MVENILRVVTLAPGLLNIVPVKEAAEQIISNLRRQHAIVFLPPVYYYIQVC
jgi:hypothetical protein